MNTTQTLSEVVKQMWYPALPEVMAYIRIHRNQRAFAALRKYSYYSLYYYMRQLSSSGEVVELYCTSGYKKRYCVDLKVKEKRNRLRSIIKYDCRLSDNKYQYMTSSGKKLVIDYTVAKQNGCMSIAESKLKILFDRKLNRYYIIHDELLSAVIEEANKSKPRLPGRTYSFESACKQTEYEQCCTLVANHEPAALAICGERRATI